MNRILVTGANGQLGNEMRRWLYSAFRNNFVKTIQRLTVKGSS